MPPPFTPPSSRPLIRQSSRRSRSSNRTPGNDLSAIRAGTSVSIKTEYGQSTPERASSREFSTSASSTLTTISGSSEHTASVSGSPFRHTTATTTEYNLQPPRARRRLPATRGPVPKQTTAVRLCPIDLADAICSTTERLIVVGVSGEVGLLGVITARLFDRSLLLHPGMFAPSYKSVKCFLFFPADRRRRRRGAA